MPTADKPDTVLLEGWSVQITHANGSTVMCSGWSGVLPPFWPLSQRKHAVQHMRDLIDQGVNAKVVRVRVLFSIALTKDDHDH